MITESQHRKEELFSPTPSDGVHLLNAATIGEFMATTALIQAEIA